MNAPDAMLRQERIDAVLALAAPRLAAAERPQVEAFARACFEHLDADDLMARTPEDLLGALLSLWQFAVERQPGTTRLRVFSPSVAEQGWASRHTVIEVVNDDMPFLVDTLTMEINRQGLTLQLIVHPVLVARRDASGRLESLHALHGDDDAQGLHESWMHIEVDRLVDPQQRAALAAGLEHVLGDVRAAVQDWQPMRQRLKEAIAELEQMPPTLPPALAAESRAFLQWLVDDHLTLLGYRCHDLVVENGEDLLRLVPGSALGILREPRQEVSASFAAVPAQVRAMARSPVPPLLVTRSNTRSTVHRPGYSDYVGIKRYDAAGQVIGEHRFIGLFTSSAYSARVDEIPLLRDKVAAVSRRAALPEGGHLAKALDHILATYPRDDLFQVGEDELYRTALGILAAGERQRLRLFLWRDPYERFVSCLIYVPREAYSTELRKKFQAILMAAFDGQRADFGVQLGDMLLARVHSASAPRPASCRPTTRTPSKRRWRRPRAAGTTMRDALVEVGEGRVRPVQALGAAFPGVPRDPRPRCGARPAEDRPLTPSQPLGLSLYRPLGATPHSLGFKVYRLGATVVLSDSLPMLEHMGVRVIGEDNFRLRRGDGDADFVSLHDFKLEAQVAAELEPETLARLFETASAASSAARSRTTISTSWCWVPGWRPRTWWCCAPTRATAGRSALRCRRPRSRPRWPRTRRSRACWCGCSS